MTMMITEKCDKCGQHIPCREMCAYCKVNPCEVKGPHGAHWHKSCGRNAELPAFWGGPVGAVPIMVGDKQYIPPVVTEVGRIGGIGFVPSMPPPAHTGQVPNMQAVRPGDSFVVPANPAVMPPTVVEQGSEPPKDFPPELLTEPMSEF